MKTEALSPNGTVGLTASCPTEIEREPDLFPSFPGSLFCHLCAALADHLMTFILHAAQGHFASAFLFVDFAFKRA